MNVGSICAFRPLPLGLPGKPRQSDFHQFPIPDFGDAFALKSRHDPAEITCMFFGVTNMYFPARQPKWVAPGTAAAWNGVAAPGEIGRPGDLPVPVGQQLRRWGALLALAGKPLPTAPPPGPVPVHGIPQPAGTAPAAPAANDLVPAEREYLRPILVRYAQENGLPADLVMALAWVESSWRRSVVSDVGAVGVMQLMPDTVDYVSKKLLGLRSDLDPKNATSNIRMGSKFLRHLLDQNDGNVRQALIA